ncbi:MAG: hypothetical protein M3N31_09345 [Actinomycetota bacterium]|nr:hypothetical protein [Actinomycetota bacterium]
MFDPTSRYAPLETATLTDADGRVIPYKRRRFLPQGRTMPLLVEVAVVQGDRLDLVTFRTLGDPEHFWRVCDANDAMNPSELTGEESVGLRLRVPVPQP